MTVFNEIEKKKWLLSFIFESIQFDFFWEKKSKKNFFEFWQNNGLFYKLFII